MTLIVYTRVRGGMNFLALAHGLSWTMIFFCSKVYLSVPAMNLISVNTGDFELVLLLGLERSLYRLNLSFKKIEYIF